MTTDISSSREHHDSKSGILQMKMQSKAYVRNAAQRSNQLTHSRKKLTNSTDLKADVEFQVGNFQTETESIKSMTESLKLKLTFFSLSTEFC